MAQFYPISRSEMSALVEPWGFALITLTGVNELVWAKKRPDGIEARIYSGINPTGESRGKGEDAIRVYLFWHKDGEVYPVGGSKRVHRVKGWRDNLKARLAAWKEQLGPACPKCGAPMKEIAVKNGPNKGKTFWGCCTWKKTKCEGKDFPADQWQRKGEAA
jgi:hypothetical protein